MLRLAGCERALWRAGYARDGCDMLAVFVTCDSSIPLSTVPPKPTQPHFSQTSDGGHGARDSLFMVQPEPMPASLTQPHRARVGGDGVHYTHLISSLFLSFSTRYPLLIKITQRSLEQTRMCYMLAMPFARVR